MSRRFRQQPSAYGQTQFASPNMYPTMGVGQGSMMAQEMQWYFYQQQAGQRVVPGNFMPERTRIGVQELRSTGNLKQDLSLLWKTAGLSCRMLIEGCITHRDELWELVAEGSDVLPIDVNKFSFYLRVERSQFLEDIFRKFEIVDRKNRVRTGNADFTELIAALITNGYDSRQAKMKALFRVFDMDGGGEISATELRKLLRATNPATSENQVNDKVAWMLKKGDANNDGQLDFDEFIRLADRFPNIMGVHGN